MGCSRTTLNISEDEEISTLAAPDDRMIVVQQGRSNFVEVDTILDQHDVTRFADTISRLATKYDLTGPTVNQNLSTPNDSLEISGGNKVRRDIVAVETVGDISGTFPINTIIEVRDNGARYRVESDSITGYVNGGVAVIDLGGNYALLQPSDDGWFVAEWFGVSVDSTDNKDAFVKLKNYAAAFGTKNIKFGTSGTYNFDYENNYAQHYENYSVIEFTSVHDGMVFDLNGARINVYDTDGTNNPNGVIWIVPQVGEDQMNTITIRNGRVSGYNIDYPTQDLPNGITISARNGVNNKHVLVENMQFDSLNTGIVSYNVDNAVFRNTRHYNMQRKAIAGYARIGNDLSVPVVVPDDFKVPLRTITIDGMIADKELDGVGVAVDMSAQDQAQLDSTYYFYRYRANISNVHITRWHSGMKTAGYVDLNVNNITFDSLGNYGFWNNLEARSINMSNFIARDLEGMAAYFQTARLNLVNFEAQNCLKSNTGSINDVLRFSMTGDSAKEVHYSIVNLKLEDSTSTNNRVFISGGGKPVYFNADNWLLKDLNNTDMAMWITSDGADSNSIYSFSDVTFINVGNSTTARAIDIRNPVGTYAFNNLTILDLDGGGPDGVRTSISDRNSKFVINNYSFAGLEEEIDDDAGVTNSFINGWTHIQGSSVDFDGWNSSNHYDDRYEFDLDTLFVNGNIVIPNDRGDENYYEIYDQDDGVQLDDDFGGIRWRTEDGNSDKLIVGRLYGLSSGTVGNMHLVFENLNGEAFRMGTTGTLSVRGTADGLVLDDTDTGVADGESMGTIDWNSNDASGSLQGIIARIEAEANGDFSASANADLVFKTNLGATGTLAEAMRLTARRQMILSQSSAEPASSTDQASIWVADVTTGQSELYARGETGNAEQITGLTRYLTSAQNSTSTTYAAISDLTFNVEAGKTYGVDCSIYVSGISDGGIKITIDGTATATNFYSGSQTTTPVTTLGADIVSVATTGTAVIYHISGSITVDAAGTLGIQFAQVDGDGGTTTMGHGSWVELKPITN